MARMVQFGRGFSGLIELPILSGTTKVGDALDAMITSRKSAVIVNEDRFHYLHTAKSVLSAPHAIHPEDRLQSVLTITAAPYLPMIDKIPVGRWSDLSSNPEVLLRQGIIQTMPSRALRIGGLITESDKGIGKLLASRQFPVRDLTIVITKCECTDGHRVLPEELVGGLCPWDNNPVTCG